MAMDLRKIDLANPEQVSEVIIDLLMNMRKSLMSLEALTRVGIVVTDEEPLKETYQALADEISRTVKFVDSITADFIGDVLNYVDELVHDPEDCDFNNVIQFKCSLCDNWHGNGGGCPGRVECREYSFCV